MTDPEHMYKHPAIFNFMKRTLRHKRLAVGALSVMGLMVVVGIFAPLLANHRPYVLINDAGVQFPLFRALSVTDWILLTVFIEACVGVVLLRRKSRIRLYVIVAMLALVLVAIVASTIRRPEIDLTDYRAAAGQGAFAVFAPIGHDPTASNINARNKPPGWRDVGAAHARPTHWLGTDDAGADVAARLIHAARVALAIGLIATGIALVLGVVFGALMGYFGGWIDMIGMRIVEIFMAIPRLFLLLTIIAFLPPQFNQYMLYAMMVVIGSTSWMGGARLLRAEFLRLRDQDFIHAARAAGLPMRSIILRHMLPNSMTPILVDTSFAIAAVILLEANLSFLGFGIKPPNPSWGQMLAQAIDPATGVFRWWLAIFPGLMIFLTVFSLNIIGDTLRDAIDPKLRSGRNHR